MLIEARGTIREELFQATEHVCWLREIEMMTEGI